MKKLTYLFQLALLAIITVSCSKGAGDDNTQLPVTKGGHIFSIGFERAPITYAPIEYSSEKNLNSVAIFIETEDRQFYKFLTTEPDGSPEGFAKVEYFKNYNAEDGETYLLVGKVEIELPADVATFSRVAVVGNYAVLGSIYDPKYSDADFRDRLLAVTSWDDLMATQAPASKLNGVRLIPGLVSTKVLTDIEVNNLRNTGKIGVLKLCRLAARISLKPDFFADYGDGNPQQISGWKSLRDRATNPLIVFSKMKVPDADDSYINFYNPKQATYLFPDFVTEEQITAIPQYERFEPLKYSSTSNTFYVYGMTGDEPEPLQIYISYGVRPKATSPWEYYITGQQVDNTVAGKCRLLPNNAYELDFPFMFPVNPGATGDWDSEWGLVARP